MSVQTWYIVVLFSQYLCKTKDKSYCCASPLAFPGPCRMNGPTHLPFSPPTRTALTLGLLCWAPDPGAAGSGEAARCSIPFPGHPF